VHAKSRSVIPALASVHELSEEKLLGCTARHAVLGIHRTQAGRLGSRLGCGQQVEARCSTTTPSIDSNTSATGTGRSATGRCRPPRTIRCRPGREPTVIAPGPPLRPGRSAPPATTYHRAGTRRRHRPRSPLRAGAGAIRAVARAGPRGPTDCAARCGLPGCRSGREGDGSPDLIAIAGPGAIRPDVGGGGSAGAALVRPPRAPYTV
jgi:hypothetical protein